MLSLLRRPKTDASASALVDDDLVDTATHAHLLASRIRPNSPALVTYTVTALVAPRGTALVLVDQLVRHRLGVTELTEGASVELEALTPGRHTVQVVFIGADGFAHSSSDLLNLRVAG